MKQELIVLYLVFLAGKEYYCPASDWMIHFRLFYYETFQWKLTKFDRKQ